MTETLPDRQTEIIDKFWNFLSHLQNYVSIIKGRTWPNNNPARKLMLSTLTEQMRPVLGADIACVGYHSIDGNSGNWLEIVEATIRLENSTYEHSPLIQRMKKAHWRFSYDDFNILNTDTPVVLFDKGLQKLPSIFKGVTTGFAVSQVILSGQKYFLFFFDIKKKKLNSPRYTEFDKAMLRVATGILEIGFQSGIYMGRKESLRNNVFISYSNKDHIWLEKLQTHLTPLQRNNKKISVWSDTQIKAGMNWREEIEKALDSAKVAILLISPNFLASDFIANKEVPRLLKKAKDEGLVIYCVAISASLYKQSKIEKYQFANNPDKPLDLMNNAKQNAEFVKICELIESAISS